MRKYVIRLVMVSLLGVGSSFASFKDVDKLDLTIKATSVVLAGALAVKYGPSIVNDVKKMLEKKLK